MYSQVDMVGRKSWNFPCYLFGDSVSLSASSSSRTAFGQVGHVSPCLAWGRGWGWQRWGCPGRWWQWGGWRAAGSCRRCLLERVVAVIWCLSCWEVAAQCLSCRTLPLFPALLAACWACLGHWPWPWPSPDAHFLAGHLPRPVPAPLESVSPSREEMRQGFTSFASSKVPWSFVVCWHPVGIASRCLQLWSCESPGLFFMGHVQIRGHRLMRACRSRKQDPYIRWGLIPACRKEETWSDFLFCSC